ncbi:cytochrome P450 71D7-like [Camellia sinensis]|uniref:cytochrome P450 71D7-like n=1 Tax=Camellia sinensis TaxID=4442 RepID=UPI00103582A9|nr:cytochrome P450 71D7-like [Camellia sinensis]XP_028093764.1 cytochrome P450 71D7-like [Camellia sinensis]
MMLHLLSLPLLLTFLLFLLAILKHWRRSKSQLLNNNTRLPPRPPKLSFIGHLHHLIGTVRSYVLTDLAEKYGPIMHLQLGKLLAMVISTAKVAEQVLKTHELNFAQRPIVHAVAVMPYHDSTIIFSPYNDHWRQM